MTSFVNLFGNDVWSEADIVRRTEAELHGVVSKDAELILSRKMIGFSLGRIIPTPEEQADLILYETAAYQAQQSGIAARTDMALLQSALGYEQALRRLMLPVVTKPAMVTVVDDAHAHVEIINPAIAADEAERAAAQAVLDAASPETLSLVALRNPPPATTAEDDYGTA